MTKRLDKPPRKAARGPVRRRPKGLGWSPERRARQAEMIRASQPWKKSTGPRTDAGKIVGLVGGGTYGGVRRGRNAIPESTAAEIQTTLNQAIADRDLQADLRQRVLQHAGSAAMGLDLGAGATEPVASPDYAAMADRGVGTILELSLTQLTFTGEGGSDPTLALVMSARARLIRIADKRELWNVADVTYESPAAAFSLWVMLDSGLLRGEIDNGSEALARQVGEALFGAGLSANSEETSVPR